MNRLCAVALSSVLLCAALAEAAPRKAISPELVAPRRLDALSAAYLGVPYKMDCLGEGKGPDRDPLFTRKAADCQTLVEQVMAEAIAPGVGGRDRAIRRTRYHGDAVSLENRYHYCIPDWLINPWPAQDVTELVAPGETVPIRRVIDLPAFLASRGGDPRRSPVQAREVSIRMIPRAQAPRVSPSAVDGTIAVFVIDRPGIVAGHVGFLFQRKDAVVLRHASQRQGKVVDQPLGEYMQAAPRSFIGLIVLRPDVRGLER